MGNLCAATLKIYAKKHNHTLRVISNLVMPDRPSPWHRISFIPELFDEGFDFVFWMDADALFLRYDRDIREVIEPGKDLYMVQIPISEELQISGSSLNKSIPNTGVMLLRNCEWTRKFLEKVWNREEYRDHPWWENAAVIDLLGYFGLLRKGEDQPNKDLLDHIKFIDSEWNSMPHVCSGSHPIVHHYAGLPLQTRIEKMTKDYLLSSSSLAEELMEENETLARRLSEVETRFYWWRILHWLDSIFHRIGAQNGFIVQQGPFAGMAYLSQVQSHDLLHGSAFVPKLLGSYEAELHEMIARVATKPYATIVNVGCGEGYYTIGLARLLQHAHIYAFDIDQRNQEWCAEMACLNNVSDRVTIAGACDLELLCALTTKPALLVIDCEGFELDLLQPDVLPGLCLCDVLVELHDFINPIISHTIRKRFAPTHTITIIDSKERDPADYPALGVLSMREQRLAVEEFRPAGMQWAFMTPMRRHDGTE
mgnify:CR=1 FL=1